MSSQLYANKIEDNNLVRWFTTLIKGSDLEQVIEVVTQVLDKVHIRELRQDKLLDFFWERNFSLR